MKGEEMKPKIFIKKLETDEDRKAVLRIHIANNYLNTKCEKCGVVYWSVDLFLEKNPICVGTNPLKLCCKKCFKHTDNK